MHAEDGGMQEERYDIHCSQTLPDRRTTCDKTGSDLLSNLAFFFFTPRPISFHTEVCTSRGFGSSASVSFYTHSANCPPSSSPFLYPALRYFSTSAYEIAGGMVIMQQAFESKKETIMSELSELGANGSSLRFLVPHGRDSSFHSDRDGISNTNATNPVGTDLDLAASQEQVLTPASAATWKEQRFFHPSKKASGSLVNHFQSDSLNGSHLHERGNRNSNRHAGTSPAPQSRESVPSLDQISDMIKLLSNSGLQDKDRIPKTPPPPPGLTGQAPLVDSCRPNSASIPPPPIPPPPGLPGLNSVPFLASEWPNILHVYSSRQLLPPAPANAARTQYYADDKVVYLPTFQRRAYVTSHSASSQEFWRYFELIKHAAEGKWYTLPDDETLAMMNGLERAGLPVGRHLPVVSDPQPIKSDIPWVHGTSALQYPQTIKSVPCKDSAAHFGRGNQCRTTPTMEAETDDLSPHHGACDEDGLLQCRKCARSKQKMLKHTELVYVSIVHSTQGAGNPPRMPMSFGDKIKPEGTDIYKIHKLGGRDAAATQAFYDAGANGWSTVFACAFRADVDWSLAAADGVERVDHLWQLGDDREEVGVFY